MSILTGKNGVLNSESIAEAAKGKVIYVDVEDIVGNDLNRYELQNIEELAENIKEKGLLEPLQGVKDDDGNVVAQRLEVVTTPFAKDEVKVSVEGNVLTVACGGSNKEEKTEDEYIYKGISSQSYTFQVRLGNSVDKTAIKAKNVDGVLTVMLPFKKKEDEPKQITNIEVE